jgi:hypothetical protein
MQHAKAESGPKNFKTLGRKIQTESKRPGQNAGALLPIALQKGIRFSRYSRLAVQKSKILVVTFINF